MQAQTGLLAAHTRQRLHLKLCGGMKLYRQACFLATSFLCSSVLGSLNAPYTHTNMFVFSYFQHRSQTAVAALTSDTYSQLCGEHDRKIFAHVKV